MDVFEPEVLPSARITLPPKTLSKESTQIVNPSSLTPNANNDFSDEVAEIGQLTTDHSSDPLTTDSTTEPKTEASTVSTSTSQSVDEITTITAEIPHLTESTVNSSPQDFTSNPPTETNTPKLKIIKKIRKTIIRKTTLKPVVEEIPEEILAAASNSGEARRAPTRV